MKKVLIVFGFLGCIFILAGFISAIDRYNKTIGLIHYLRFQHTRDSLIMDSLRNSVDTTEFLTEHSEIKH